MSLYHLFLGGNVHHTVRNSTRHEPYTILVPPHTTGEINVHIDLVNPKSEAHVVIVQWICHGKVRIATTQTHKAPHTTSSIDIRAVVGSEGQSIYDGLIAIHAQQSNATQSHRALMIADSAQAQATPALEVLTNDVHCSHASAIGPIDEHLLIPCLTRGISRNVGRLLIAYGILRDAIAQKHPAQEVISSWMCHK